MKTSFVILAAVLLFALTAVAQDVPKFETFLGYTYVRANPTRNVPAFNANGGGGQFSYNFNHWIGAVADIGAVHNGGFGGHQIDNTTTNFLFGPRLSFRYPRLRPYFQFLWGGVYQTANITIEVLPTMPGQPITARVGAQQTAFAMTAGGGLDIKISRMVSLRPIGLDYYMTRLQSFRTEADNTQNNLRYTAGINFTFGAR